MILEVMTWGLRLLMATFLLLFCRFAAHDSWAHAVAWGIVALIAFTATDLFRGRYRR